MFRVVVTVAVFYLAFVACTYGSINAQPVIGTAATILAFSIALLLSPERGKLAAMGLFFGLFGLAAESGLQFASLVNYRTPGTTIVGVPVYVVGLWIVFSILITPALNWLHRRYILAIVLGAIAGPFTYYGVAQLDALSMADPVWIGIGATALIWATVMPLALLLQAALDRRGVS